MIAGNRRRRERTSRRSLDATLGGGVLKNSAALGVALSLFDAEADDDVEPARAGSFPPRRAPLPPLASALD